MMAREVRIERRGAPGLDAAEKLFVTRDADGERLIPAPTGEALFETLTAPLTAAAASVQQIVEQVEADAAAALAPVGPAVAASVAAGEFAQAQGDAIGDISAAVASTAENRAAAEQAAAQLSGSVAAVADLQATAPVTDTAIAALSIETTAGRTATPVAGTGLGGRTNAINAPRAARERCWKVEVYCQAAGTLNINRQSRSGTTMTVLETITVPVVAGLNTFTEAQLGKAFWFNAGEYPGLDAANGILASTATSSDSVGYYSAIGSLTSYEAADPRADRLEARFFFRQQTVSDASQRALSDNLAKAEKRLAVAQAINAQQLGTATRIGRQNDPVAGTANSNRTYYLPSAARANTGYLTEVKVFANAAGAIGLKIGRSDGTNINQVATATVTLAAGLNTLTTDDFGYLPVGASDLLGLVTPIGIVPVTAVSADSVGYYTATGDAAAVPLSSLNNPRLEAAFTVTQFKAAAGTGPLQRWKGGFEGLRSVPKAMASGAPTIIVGAAGAASAIPSPLVVGKDDARIAKVGTTFSDVLTNYKQGTYSGGRLRFIHAGSRFEPLLLTGNTGRGISVLVDGEYVSKEPFPPGMLNGTGHRVLYDFGPEVRTYTLIDNQTVANGGSGYVQGEIVTLAGGTSILAAQVIVTAVGAGGAATTVKPYRAGSYSAVPAHNTNVGQASTTGSGIGLQIRPIWSKRHTTRKARKIEITLDAGTRFGGINFEGDATVVPWPDVPAFGRWMFIGDSYAAYAQADYADGTFAAQLAWMLGVHDSYWRVGYSGMGWLVGGPSGTGIDGIASYVTENVPDVAVITLGGNDETFGSDPVAVQAKVTATLNAYQAALPEARFVVVPAWTCGAAMNAAILAGVAAVGDQSRIRSVDIRSRDIYTNDGTGEEYRTTDDNHPGQLGNDYLALMTGPLIASAVLEMV